MKSLDPFDPRFDLPSQHAFVRSLARRLVREEAAAEDLAQEAWLRVLGKPDVEPRSARAWLARIVHQLALSTWRSDAARTHRELRRGATARATESPDLLDGEDEDDARERVQLALRGLPASQRQVIHLRYYEGLAPRDIAVRLDLPVETVRTRLKRAHAALRMRLAGDEVAARGGRLRALVAWILPLRSRHAVQAAWAAVAALCVLAPLVLFARRERAQPVVAAAEQQVDPQRVISTPAGERGTIEVAAAEVEEPIASDRGSLSLAFVESATGAPAGGVAFELDRELFGSRDAPLPSQRADAAGRALVELASGVWRIAPERGRAAMVAIREGERSELTLALPSSVSVSGIVLDAAAGVIAGARVYATRPFRTDGIVRETVTDDSGRFRFEGVDPGSWIGAAADEHVDGALTFLGDPRWDDSEPRELELVLEPTAASFEAFVRDASGRPVAGALVEPVLNLRARSWRSPALPFLEPSRIQEARVADKNGRVALDDLPPFPWDLFASAEGLAPTRLALELRESPASPRQLPLQLDAGRTLAGRVFLPSGEPAEGAEVWVGASLAFEPPTTRTAADGSFLLERLPRIELRARASLVRDGEVLAVRATFDVAQGDRLDWQAELASGNTIRGEIARAEGSAGLLVSARSVRTSAEDWIPNENPTPVRWTTTDAQGRFAFDDCTTTHRIDVWEAQGGALRHLDSFDEVRASASTLRFALRPLGSIAGSFWKEGDAEPRSALWISHQGWQHPRQLGADEASGRFHAEGLTQGRYVFFTWRPGRTPGRTCVVELAPGEHREVRPIVLVAPGALHARVRGADGPVRESIELGLHAQATDGAPRGPAIAMLRLEPGEDAATIAEVPPGDYALVTGGSQRALEWFPVTVVSGSTSEAEIELAPSARGTLDVYLPPGEVGASRLLIRICDESDRTRLRTAVEVTEDGSVAAVPLALPRGRYSFRVQVVPGERAATGDFVVEDVGEIGSFAAAQL